ncbi:ORF6C domain-containing protein [Oceanobacillus kimchii]|uniref:ORF6C domain-containing protein n=1 Tax=Oceanobacillus kimchii TaxID=746691 RepID=UPI003B013F8C
MNQLKVVSQNGQLVTESRIVARMIERTHSELLKDIRRYASYLSEGDFHLGEFFIESTYTDSNNQKRPCFLITKKGCDMVANKTTGQKGVLFTAAYVTEFEEMEKQTQQPKALTEKEQRIEMLKLSLELEETTKEHANRITYLEDHMRIDGIQEKKLQDKGKSIAIQSLGGFKSNAYQKVSRKVFSAIWRDFKNHFNIPRYNELPRKQFDEAIAFLEMWQPSTTLRIEIQNLNNQQTLNEVI